MYDDCRAIDTVRNSQRGGGETEHGGGAREARSTDGEERGSEHASTRLIGQGQEGGELLAVRQRISRE